MMAKKNDRGQVRMTERANLSREGHIALNNLSDVLHGTSLKNVLDAAKILKKECGEDAEVTFEYDCFHGDSDITIRWYRDETDDEWAKRLEKNKANRKKALADKKAAAAKKEVDERNEFARLQEKFG